MTDKFTIDGDPYVDYRSKIIAVRKTPVVVTNDAGEQKKIEFETAFRAPGVRLIIPTEDNKGLLLTREYRKEHNGYDYRLPGGKVFDKLEQYEAFLASGDDLLVPGKDKAIAEGGEEAGIAIRSLEHYVTAKAGGTMEWDLQYWVATGWSQKPGGQALEHGEDIEVVEVAYTDLIKLIKDGEMNEYRSIGVLFRWSLENGLL